jgi:hypothetical protein
MNSVWSDVGIAAKSVGDDLAGLAASLKPAKAGSFVVLQTIIVTRYDSDAGDWAT